MNALVAFATGLVRTWTATYTRGLPGATRDERIDEIDADLWEQGRFAQIQKQPPAATAAEIFGRLVLGMPADVLWRIETGASIRTRRSFVNSSLFMRLGLVAVTLLLGLLIVNGVAMMAFGVGEFDSVLDQVLWGFAFTACPVAAVVGLWLSGTRPKLGVGLVVAGVLGMSLTMFWMWFLVLPAGLPAIAMAIRRSGLAIWPMRGRTPSAA